MPMNAKGAQQARAQGLEDNDGLVNGRARR